MSVPKYNEMYKSFLKALRDGEPHSSHYVQQQISNAFHLTQKDLEILQPSGKGNLFKNRVGWCHTYLKNAGLIENPKRGIYKITEAGKNIYDTVDVITDDTLRDFQSFIDFAGDKAKKSTENRTAPEIDLNFWEKNASPEFAESLTDDILKKVAELRGKKIVSQKELMITQRERDPYISEYVKRRSMGICDLCSKYAPFLDKKGRPYLECHHVIWLSNNGEDTIENTVALCPNCHRKMHIQNLPEDVMKLKKVLKCYEIGVPLD